MLMSGEDTKLTLLLHLLKSEKTGSAKRIAFNASQGDSFVSFLFPFCSFYSSVNPQSLLQPCITAVVDLM